MSLIPGPLTFSHDRLCKVWRDHQVVRGALHRDYYKTFIHESNQNPQQPRAARKFCLKLYSSVQDPRNHLTELDSSFESINLRPFMKTALSESVVSSPLSIRMFQYMQNILFRSLYLDANNLGCQVIEKACRILSQLPAIPQDILDALPFHTTSLQEYQLQSLEVEAMGVAAQVYSWKQLRVVHHVDNYVLRLALHVAVRELETDNHRHGFASGDVADSIVVLLQLSLQISAEEGMQDTKWSIVCAFLWTSWQRSLMIHLWSCLAAQLRVFDYESSVSLHRKGINLIPQIFMSLSRQHLEELHHMPYLCGWAFRSLRNDRANIAMDLRHFHKLYYAHFGKRSPVCNQGPAQCDGSSSHDCKRFKNTGAKNQSMHDYNCQGYCQRLFWSRESFMNVRGAKAVDIVTTDFDILRYCKVSESTLTVSHVWSHGQGGRPDNIGSEGTGFNLCLHRRYAELAISLGCESYWMDTPCIPSEKELRWECIAQITSIFATSGKTIICDRDIMAIDISNPTIHAYESILATLLVCDWGIRAWTLLEAMRGRNGLFVLCRHNKLINLHQLLRSVHDNGRMDLVNLFLARDYLFPQCTYDEVFPGHSIKTEVMQKIEEGFVSIGEAAALLSHRHATRDGDDLLIWSLLIGDIEDDSPIAMWERQVGKQINTGSLVSSAKRIHGHPGLGWAPFSPTALQGINEQSTGSKVYPAFDGCETVNGLITPEGLRAQWLTYEFPNVTAFSVDKGEMQDSYIPRPCMNIAAQLLPGYNWGALLQTMPRKGPRTIPIPYRESLGRVVVVCGSLDKAVWEWRDIYEWDVNIALPPFTMKEILIT